MSLLLDTHVALWLLEDDPKLGRESVRLVERAISDGAVYVSAISFWEIGLLTRKNRLELPMDVLQWRNAVLDLGVSEIPLTGDIGIISTELEGLPADPADRIIVATALTYEATLTTADARILGWQGALDRQDARI